MQTFNVKFRFDDSGLEVVLGKQEEETENAFVGGKNRWEFDSFTNWEFWWPSFPVLVYFKVSCCKQGGHLHESDLINPMGSKALQLTDASVSHYPS